MSRAISQGYKNHVLSLLSDSTSPSSEGFNLIFEIVCVIEKGIYSEEPRWDSLLHWKDVQLFWNFQV